MSNSIKHTINISVLTFFLSGCSTISGWFADEEELAIRTLPEIEKTFQSDIVWDREVGEGVDNYFSRLSPAIGNGKIFAADREGIIVALSPEDGGELWKLDIRIETGHRSIWNLFGFFTDRVSAKVAGGITLAGNRLYLGTEDGEVIAINEADGSIAWRTTVRSEVLASPAIDSGIVVVNTSAGILMGLDANTGELKWENESDVPPLTLRGISAPAAANGGAIVGLATGRLQVSIIDSGLTAWEQVIAKPTGATELERIVDVDSQPLVFGGTVYVLSYAGALSAVELRSGNVIWSREYSSYRNLSIFGNRLFLTDNNSNVYAVDRRNGVELWSSGELRRRTLTEPTPVGSHIVVGDKFGYLHWFTQDEGDYVSRLRVGDDDEDEGIFIAPIYKDNLLVVQTRDGDLNLVSTP